MHPVSAGALDGATTGATGTAGTKTGPVAAAARVAPAVAVFSAQTAPSDRAVPSAPAVHSDRAARSAQTARSGPVPLDRGGAALARRAAAASRVRIAPGAPTDVDRAVATDTTPGVAARGTAVAPGTVRRPAPKATEAAVVVRVGAARAAAMYAPPPCSSSPRSP